MTDTAPSTITSHAATPAPWPVFAADYRQRVHAYESDMTATGDDGEAQDALHDAHQPHYDALIAYPVQTVGDLAEKGELIALDCWDHGAAFAALTADAQRIAANPDRTAWAGAVAAYELAAAAAHAPNASDEDADAEGSAWIDLFGTTAPTAQAILYKLETVIEAGYCGTVGDSLHNPDTVHRLTNARDGVRGVELLMNLRADLQRLAGVSAPVIPDFRS